MYRRKDIFTGKAVMNQMKLFLPCFVLFVTNLISYKVKKNL